MFSKRAFQKLHSPHYLKCVYLTGPTLAKPAAALGFRSDLFTVILAPHLKEGLLLPP